MRATDNRKIHQFDFVGKQPSDPYQPNQVTMVVKSITDLCKWAAEKYSDAAFLGIILLQKVHKMQASL